MSFIVKGFDIPKDAMFFKLSFYNEDGDTEYGVRGSLKPYIIQIPKEHGDIKDADELINHLRKDPLFDMVERYGITGVIKSRPTILEAEE